MKKFKLDAFWGAMAGAGALLVVIVAIWILPAWASREREAAEIAGLDGQITTLRGDGLAGAGSPGVPGEPDLTTWESRHAYYAKDYKDIVKFYLGRDRELERWFKNAQPSDDQFGSLYSDDAKKLEALLRSAGIKVGLPKADAEGDIDPASDGLFGFNWVDINSLKLGDRAAADRQRIIKELQKRFRICEHVAFACQGADLKVLRLNDVYFFKPVDDSRGAPQPPRPPSEDRIVYVNDPNAPGDRGRGFDEFVLPDNGEKKPEGAEGADPRKPLGRTITFGVCVTISYPDAPKFIREMLSPSRAASAILVNLVGAQITIRDQNPLTEEVPVKFIKGDAKDEQAKKDEALRRFEQGIAPQPVQLLLTCQAIDFDDTAPPEWARQ